MIDYYKTRAFRSQKSILDSSIITQTTYKPYNIKIISCGEYIDIYSYRFFKLRKRKKQDKFYSNNLRLEYDGKNTIKRKTKRKKIILIHNRTRTIMTLKNIIKGNEKHFKSFITLTFKDIENIETAHKHFNIWRTRIKKEFPELLYIAVPEYQKRGSIHYHLITNISLNSDILPQRPLLKTYNYTKEKEYSFEYYDIKYWKYGFSTALPLQDISDIANYLSKYLFKDADNRFFGYRKYYVSQNIIRPKTSFIDTSDINDFKSYVDFDILEYERKYQSFYTDNISLNHKLKKLNLLNTLNPDDFIKYTDLQITKYTEYKLSKDHIL